jgi:putative endonuclease
MGSGHRRGDLGEELAARWLEERGWRILDRRWRIARGEVDLVAQRAGTLAFVEVKTRRGHACGDPLEAVTWRKRRDVERVAQHWLAERGGGFTLLRFDVIGVTLGPCDRLQSLHHLEGAWQVGE